MRVYFAALLVLSGSSPTAVFAQIAGEWTQCIGRAPGQPQWNIVNGQNSAAACKTVGKICMAGLQYEITYYSNPVIINAPYTRCTATVPQAPQPPVPPPVTPPPDPRVVAAAKSRQMHDAVISGNDAAVRAYLQTGTYDPTWAEVWSTPYNGPPSQLQKVHWLQIIFESQHPSRVVKPFLEYGMDVKAPRQWGQFLFTVKRYFNSQARDSAGKEEVLATIALLMSKGYGPDVSTSPSADANIMLQRLVMSCLVDGDKPDPQFAVKAFNVLATGMGPVTMRKALLEADPWNIHRTGTFDDLMRALANQANEALKRPTSGRPDRIAALRKEQADTVARFTACVPMADRMDEFLGPRKLAR